MKLRNYHYVLLIALLMLAFFRTYYGVHADYRFPYHHDEWQHLGISIQAMEEGYNLEFNPFLEVPGWHADLESGFHLFLSSLFLITGADPLLNYQYLAAIFSIITGFAIFLCVFRLTDRFFAGILSLIVFISLKSNVNILGKDYFVPMTMAMPFIFLFILYFLKSIRERNSEKFVFSMALILVIFLIHPPSAVILGLPALAEVFLNLDFMRKVYGRFKILILALPLFAFIVGLLLWKGESAATIGYIKDLLIFEQGWGKIEIAFFMPALYGWISTLFAVYGFIVAHKKGMRFFMVFAFISLAMASFFNIFGFSLLIPYSRAIHFAMLSLIPLTALGFLSALYTVDRKFLKDDKLKTVASMIFLIAILSFSHYGLDQSYKKYSQPVLDEYDYSALLWIKDNYGTDSTIITPYFMTSAVYPVSGNKAISLIPSQMGGGLIEENMGFYTLGCGGQKDIAEISGANLVLSKLPIECDFLEQLYLRGDFVYSVKAT